MIDLGKALEFPRLMLKSVLIWKQIDWQGRSPMLDFVVDSGGIPFCLAFFFFSLAIHHISLFFY